MEDQHADVHIISSLDDVAWTLNLRGSDVQSNPVFLGYIVLSKMMLSFSLISKTRYRGTQTNG